MQESKTSQVFDIEATDMYSFVKEHTKTEGHNVVMLLYSPLCPHSLTTLPQFSKASADNSLQFGDKKTTFARMDALHNDIDVIFGGESLCPGFPTMINFESVEEWSDYRKVIEGGITVEGIEDFATSSSNSS